MILIGVMATIAPYLGNGPTWYVVESAAKGCQENWWHNLLYVNNLVKYNDPEAPGVSLMLLPKLSKPF